MRRERAILSKSVSNVDDLRLGKGAWLNLSRGIDIEGCVCVCVKGMHLDTLHLEGRHTFMSGCHRFIHVDESSTISSVSC